MSANTGTIALTAGRDVLLDSNIVTSSATADAIQLSAGDNFTNNAGSDALQAANSNWVVYSDSPVGNQNNGLLPDESVYGQVNIGATIASKTAGGNNVFGYNTGVRPTVTYDVDNNSVEYGDAITGNSLTYNTGLVVMMRRRSAHLARLLSGLCVRIMQALIVMRYLRQQAP